VIADLTVSATEFELGRILELNPGERLELETMIPLGQKAVPFFLVHDQVRETFEERVQDHPSVDRVQEVDRHGGERLYTLQWDTSSDHFFNAMATTGAQLLTATGSATTWQFELRFVSHEALSQFHELCDNARVDFEVERVYNPTKPTLGPWYGLTEHQRETLARAVEGGYYAIPRQLSTKDLAEEFDISDQAVTERLRRAITTLTENTLIVTAETETDEE
jgi:predicted DNA binding protein